MVTELRATLASNPADYKTTTKRLSDFSEKFKKDETKTTLEKIRDPETKGFLRTINNILYHTLNFFFKPKGAQLAHKVESKLKDFNSRGLAR